MSTPEGPLQPTGAGAGSGLTGRRILVVEDDHNLGSVIVATLASAGVDTTLVRSPYRLRRPHSASSHKIHHLTRAS